MTYIKMLVCKCVESIVCCIRRCFCTGKCRSWTTCFYTVKFQHFNLFNPPPPPPPKITTCLESLSDFLSPDYTHIYLYSHFTASNCNCSSHCTCVVALTNRYPCIYSRSTCAQMCDTVLFLSFSHQKWGGSAQTVFNGRVLPSAYIYKLCSCVLLHDYTCRGNN